MKKIKMTELEEKFKADNESGVKTTRPWVPYTRDFIQGMRGNLAIPEIRVWCHPHKVGRSGDDGYAVFDTFKEAEEFIRGEGRAQGCEDVPLIAFRGYEINIHDLPAIVHNDLNDITEEVPNEQS